jgi:hypothetical protein
MARQSYASQVTTFCACMALFVACKSDRDSPPTLDPKNERSDGGTSFDGGSGATGSNPTTNTNTNSRRDAAASSNGGRGRQVCPATRPSNGSACVSGSGDCTIGGATCDCPDETNQWVCWEPSDCPSSAPSEAAACKIVGSQCAYDVTADAGRAADELECECSATGWACESEEEEEGEEEGEEEEEAEEGEEGEDDPPSSARDASAALPDAAAAWDAGLPDATSGSAGDASLPDAASL